MDRITDHIGDRRDNRRNDGTFDFLCIDLINFQNIFKADSIFQSCMCCIGGKAFSEENFVPTDTADHNVCISDINCKNQNILHSAKAQSVCIQIERTEAVPAI